jgi:transcriptional regulator with XRE-family HTH domain
MTPAQSRAARGLMDWSQSELATRSNLSESTIRDFEKGRRLPSLNNLAAIERALEAAGIEFIPEDDDSGPGIRLRKGFAGPGPATAAASASKRSPRTQEAPRKLSRQKRR